MAGQDAAIREVLVVTSAAPRRLDRGDVDFLHAHHGIECAFCFSTTGRHRLCQHARRDLPGDAPLVLAPAARTLLAAIADNGVPVAVGLLLIIGGDLKRESLVMLEHGTAVQAKAGDAGDCEFHRQHVALLAGWVVTGCTVDGTDGAVGKGFGVEAGRSLCVLVVPQANRVLGHCLSFRWAYALSAGFYRCCAVAYIVLVVEYLLLTVARLRLSAANAACFRSVAHVSGNQAL